MAKICLKWLIDLGIGLMFEPKYLGNDVDLWEMAQIKWHYLTNCKNDLSIWKYLGNA